MCHKRIAYTLSQIIFYSFAYIFHVEVENDTFYGTKHTRIFILRKKVTTG